jgi:hypothetical protein
MVNASMERQNDSDGKALWSLTWRSILLIPLMLPVALLWLVLVLSIAGLPFLAAAYLWFGLWRHAAAYFLTWALLF